MRKYVMILILASLASLAMGQISAIDFADSLYERNRPQLDSILTFTAKKTLEQHEIPATEENCEKIRSLLFLHHLFTSGADVTGNYGGILQIPYFWHWCENNPRHNIIYRPSNENLTTVPAPEGFGKYKSRADIDRTPAIYLQDLFADTALYYHSFVGNMFTFGWCSEREMAFGQMVRPKGYKMKVYQNSSHVWSEILVSFMDSSDVEINRIIRVDNTFDYFDMVELYRSEEQWYLDQGEGSMKAWYNKLANSKEEADKIADMTISSERFEEMNRQVLVWIESFRK